MICDPLEKVKRAHQLWAQWHGGYSYRCPGPDEDIEQFGALNQAVLLFFDRYYNRTTKNTPCVDDTCTMRLYLSDPTGARDPYPDAILKWNSENEDNPVELEAC